MRASLLVLAACGSSARAPAPPPPAPDTHGPALDKIAADAVAKAPLLGLSVEVVHAGQVVLAKAYGDTSIAGTTPVTIDTPFAIGSLTKQFTAAAVLQLVEAGKVKLDALASTYVPALTLPVTVRQLLWQTAGLHEDLLGEYGKEGDAVIQVISDAGTEFPPGTKWRYSNSNYIALSRVIERVSGQRYADYVHDHLLKPAGMTATTPCPKERPGAQPSISRGGGRISAGLDLDNGFVAGAGVLCSTVGDLVRWQHALFGGEVIAHALLALMVHDGVLADGTPTHYGAGLMTDTVSGHRRVWHNGALAAGYESELAYYPDDDLQIVLLSNTFGGKNTLGLLDAALARAELDIPPPPFDVARATEAAGTYRTPKVALELRIVDGVLHLIVEVSSEDHPVHFDGPDQLAFDDLPSFRCRLLRTDGKISGMELIVDDKVAATLTRD